MGRKVLAGILGGIAFFIWSSIAHLALGLGEVGISEIPNEQAVVTGMKANVTQSGLYLFPGWGLGANATHAQKMVAMKDLAPKIKAGPTGILVYRAQGSDPLSPRQLITELLTNMVQVLLAVLLLGQTSLASFAARWRFITVVGILAAISTNISYWNWYGFPGNYTLAYMLNISVGFAVAGLVAAALVKPAASTMPAAAR